MDQILVKKKLYVETTIPSFYFNERSEPEMVACCRWPRKWWDVYRHDFDCYTSDAVSEELNDEQNSLRREKLSLVADLPLLEITQAVMDTVEIYISRFIMPRDPAGDALHL